MGRAAMLGASMLLVACGGGQNDEPLPRTPAEVASDVAPHPPAPESPPPSTPAHVSKHLASTRAAHLTSANANADAGDREPVATWSTNPTPLQPPPTPAEDARILGDIKKSIAGQSALSQDAPAVTVRVTGGVVTLLGTVKDEQTRAAFEAIVRNTRGVTRIDSLLRAKNPSPIDLTPGPTGY
jgi:hypothetical protein